MCSIAKMVEKMLKVEGLVRLVLNLLLCSPSSLVVSILQFIQVISFYSTLSRT